MPQKPVGLHPPALPRPALPKAAGESTQPSVEGDNRGAPGQALRVLVVFEGIDGSGKTTLSKASAEAIRASGRRVVWTREPTDGPYGARLRQAAARGERFAPREELELFMADRAQHVTDVVRPALDRGDHVVQDRSFYSTAAYQGARGLDRDAILERGRSVAPEPDLLFVLDLPVEDALARVAERGAVRDAFEHERALQDVRAFFQGLRGIVLLDARRSQADLLQEVLARVVG